MRWEAQRLGAEADAALPGLAKLNNLVRSVRTPEFAGITFHEVLAKTALNKVPGGGASYLPSWTINPYRGCSHQCVYCVSPETMVLMADGRQRPISSIAVGEAIMGTRTEGAYRRYVPSRVLAKWSSRKRAYRVTLADGTELVASGDHRFLTDRGWKHLRGAMSGADRRPHLTPNNKLMGFGSGKRIETVVPEQPDYRRGYLTGMIRGDAMMLRREYPRTGGTGRYLASMFRLALADVEALDRSRGYLTAEGIVTATRPFAAATENRRAMTGIFTSKSRDFDAISALIEWPERPNESWQRGFLAGIFDAEGSCSRGVLRISNSDVRMLGATIDSLEALGFAAVLEKPRENGVSNIRLLGGLAARDRFFRMTQPSITRKLDLQGRAVKSDAELRVMSIEDLGVEIEMIDITTETEDFIANGVIAHNCFARPTHRYLDFNMGDDFDHQIVVKVNVAEILRRETSKSAWQASPQPVALGTNTDPYQRAEGRYKLMPEIIDALAASGTPFSILTKGTLLRRDLSLIKAASEHAPVDIAMSIAIYDDELQQSIEPGTPRAKERLATVTAVRDAGLACQVFLMPILPWLTDGVEHLDFALASAKEAGASAVLYTPLHLKGGVKQWFTFWLEREHPELVSKYTELYKASPYAPKPYREWLADRMRPLLRKHGLERGREDPATGGVASSARPTRRTPRFELGALESADASTLAGPQPTLF